MAHTYVLTKHRFNSESTRDVPMATPSRGVEPDHVACALSTENVDIAVEFSRSEVTEMLNAFPDYIPTMDAVLRFMRNNPETSAAMMSDLSAKPL